MQALTDAQIDDLPQICPNWHISNDRKTIEICYKLADFPASFGFMTEIAIICQAINHHPEWTNIYNKIWIRLSTHDIGGLSDLDIQLAQKIDKIAHKAGASQIL